MPSAFPELRPVVAEDAPLVADLETAISPDDPRDPVMMAFWWTHHTSTEKVRRWVGTTADVACIFVFAGHDAFDGVASRFGRMRVRIHPEEWTADRYRGAIAFAEDWLKREGADTSVNIVRSDFEGDIDVMGAIGFAEARRTRLWRLDLVEGRDRLLAAAARERAAMDRQGVQLLTLDQDRDPDGLRKLYELDLETTLDIPKTVPEPVPAFEEWRRFWFENPAHTAERFWIARQGDDVLGMSVIGYPPVRGVPWTSFTCTARTARGRGIARALKHATVEQAIRLGASEVETANDAENAPILHLNDEMGYRLHRTLIELHHRL